MRNLSDKLKANNTSYHRDQRIHRLLVGSAWTSAAILVNRMLPVLLVIVLAVLVQPTDLGIFALVVAFYTVLSLFADLGIAYALPKFIQENPDNAVAISATSMTLRLVASILLAIICWLTDYCWGIFKGYGGPVGLLIIASVFIAQYYSLTARLKFRESNLTVIFRGVIWFALSILLVLAGSPALGPVYGLAIAFAITGLIVIFWEGTKYYLGFYPGLAVKIVKYSSLIMLASGLNVLAAQAGIITLGYLATESEVGVFKLAMTFGTAPMILKEIIVTPLLPVVKQCMMEDPSAGLELMRNVIRYLVLAAFLILGLGLLISEPFISLFFGEKYLTAVSPLRLLLLANVLGALFTVLISVGYMMGDMRSLTRISAVVAGLCIGGSLLLIPSQGGNGAALALCLSNGVGLLLLGLWLRRKTFAWIQWRECGFILVCFLEMMILGLFFISVVPEARLRLIISLIIPPLIYFGALLLHKSIRIAEIFRFYQLLRMKS